MTLDTMHDLLIDELKDIYSAESQILQALPTMAAHATAPALVKAFEDHLEQTRGQVSRLDTIFQHLGVSPRGQTCKAMEGLLAEGAATLAKKGDDTVLDAAIIAAAQRVEHYEIAAYGSAHAFAKLMHQHEIADLLEETLDEEKEANDLLTTIAESKVNTKAPLMRELQRSGR